MTEYEAAKAALEMIRPETIKWMARLREILNRPDCPPTPPGFKRLDTAPFDGTFVRLRYRPFVGCDQGERIGRWRVMPDGFMGWFNKDDEVVGAPLFWAPIDGTFN